MAQQVIDIGAAADDKTGDPIRTAFDKTNTNDAQLFDGTGIEVKATGAPTARSLPDRLRDRVNVFDVLSTAIVTRITSGTSSSADGAAITAAITSLMTTVGVIGGEIYVPPGLYYLGSRLTVPAKVTIRGAGSRSTIFKITSNDRVIVLGDGASLIGVQADANNQQDSGLPQKLSAVQVGSNCYVEDVWARNAYTGFATAGADNYFINLRSTDHASRGISLTPGALRNIVDGIYASNCDHAGIIFGGAASGNIIRNFVIRQMTLPGVWFHEGSFANVVCDGFIDNPIDATVAALSFTPGAHHNHCKNIQIRGHNKAIQFAGDHATVAEFPGLADHETDYNTVENVTAIGNGVASAYAVLFTQVSADGPNCTNNIIRNCLFDNFYGVFFNNSDAANGCEFSDIRTANIGAGGVMKGMKSNGTDTIKIRNVQGFPTKVTVESGSIAIDSTGNKNADTSHTLLFTPINSRITFSLIRQTAVSDFVIGNIMCPTITSTLLNVRAQVTTASATAGAVVRVQSIIDMQAEDGFLTSRIT
jgi:hypothetical protein